MKHVSVPKYLNVWETFVINQKKNNLENNEDG